MGLSPNNNIEFEHRITADADPYTEVFKQVYNYRALIGILAMREIKVKYSNSGLRQFWAILKPMLMVSLYLFVFINVLHVSHTIYNYPLIVISGLLVWQPFVENIYSSGKAVFLDSDTIKKSNIPRLIFPIYRTLLILPDIIIMLLFFVAAAVYYNSLPPIAWAWLLLPVAFALNLALILGIALLSNTWYFLKPNRHYLFFIILPFVLWITPVFYVTDMVPVIFRHLLFFNPFTAIVNIYRVVLIGTPISAMQWLPGTIIALMIFVGGIREFVKHQAIFSERL